MTGLPSACPQSLVEDELLKSRRMHVHKGKNEPAHVVSCTTVKRDRG